MYSGPERKARISFDVSIDGPILLIPKHAFSPDLMVGDIGHLTVSNSFRYEINKLSREWMRRKKWKGGGKEGKGGGKGESKVQKEGGRGREGRGGSWEGLCI